MNWLVIGCSPMAIESTAAARDAWPIDTTITTNRGIEMEPKPDYYFLSDAKACKNHIEQARTAHAKGVICVTLRREDHALKNRGVEWFDIIMDEKPPYEPFKLSGLWCLEFAARNGAEVVCLAGLDGWSRDKDADEYFDASLGRRYHNTHWIDDIILPRYRLLASKYPHIQWVQYGRPEYEVGEPNWLIHRL